MVSVTDSRQTVAVSGTDAAVSGRLLAVLPEAVNRTCGSFDRSTRQFMSEYDITDPQPAQWFPQVTVVTMYEQLESAVGTGILERIGRFLPALVDDEIAEFTGIESWYDTVHRDHEGSIRFQSTGSRRGEIVVETPYPDAFEDGLVRGLCREIQTDSMQVYVTETDPTTETESRYEVSWYRIGSQHWS